MIHGDCNEEDETPAAIRRGIADLEAGRTFDLDEVFDELDARLDFIDPYSDGRQ